MASKPGILTEWPWTWLGNFKYVVLAPFVGRSIQSLLNREDGSKIDIGYLIIFPFLLFRMLHNQIWISLSRYRTAKGDNRILDKTIEFDQVDRERNWYVYSSKLFCFHTQIKLSPQTLHKTYSTLSDTGRN
ncbi:hypothetical protein H5410_063956 [Solanum commersonii]|uniref:Uncharacterized protein n=1 Tax=Solanum commersonii TaxID=4109 RepID=A0A9J5W102_SOLCO|nr:hypothetical protein H5410_063956 [Solanum commersonii]